jgi:TIR domain
MATKVFISWSGPLSQRLGEALHKWLPSALQFVKPYFSPEDIEKGAKWGSEISNELESSNIGVICLTQDNTEKPWILFEAGALSKSLERSLVCTLLFGMENSDVKGPLTSFQSTRFNKEDFQRLFATINSAAGEFKLENMVLDKVFEMWWPQLEAEITSILKSNDKVEKKERRTERDILEELLELTRMNSSRAVQPRISERAVIDLIESLDELQFVLSHENDKIGMRILERLDRPLRHLCDEAGVPELYERFRIGNRRVPRPPSIDRELLREAVARRINEKSLNEAGH